jgi:hypothetical protein
LEWREASSYMMKYLERLERETYKQQNPEVPIVDEEPMPIDPVTGKEDILFASIQEEEEEEIIASIPEEEEEDIVDWDHPIFSTKEKPDENTTGWGSPNLSITLEDEEDSVWETPTCRPHSKRKRTTRNT